MRHLLLVAVFVGGCSSPDDVFSARQIPAEDRAGAAAVARASNQFACDLYTALAPLDGNLFLSPLSISTALAMVDAGAAGTTDEELRSALHVDLPGDQMHAANRAVLASLDIGRDHGAYTLATANRLFGQAGLQILPRFLEITRRDYGAELMSLDFAQDAEAAREVINDWIADNTEDLIPELFAPGSLTANTLLVLANAIVFKGTWERAFKASATEEAPFRLADGTTVQTPLMTKLDSIALARIPGGQIGVLPFHGKDLSLIVAVPDRDDGLPELEAQLSADAITQWIDSAVKPPEDITVQLPRFKLRSSFDLVGPLAKLGLVRAFSSAADFSQITGERDLHIGSVIHEATVSIDEAGAEAAAATAVVITDSGPPAFSVTRPFVFWIHDHVTGAILFLGRVTDPTRS